MIQTMFQGQTNSEIMKITTTRKRKGMMMIRGMTNIEQGEPDDD